MMSTACSGRWSNSGSTVAPRALDMAGCSPPCLSLRRTCLPALNGPGSGAHDSHTARTRGPCWAVAGRIRSTDTIEKIRQAQWDGAALARDHALAAWLHTIARHPRPAFVLGRMLRMACYLGEPRWLQQLQRGGRADLYTA